MSILDRFSLTDRVAVVTGAGRGIGAASAVALAEAGADVVLSARTAEQLEEVRQRVEQAGRRALVVTADATDTDELAGLAERAASGLGRLDVVVNNVGGWMPRELLKTNVQAMEQAFHFNVSTAHALSRASAGVMLRTEGDKAIVNISSVVGRTAARGYLAYGTAKGALAHWTRLASHDLAPRIRVNAISVGSVMTSALEYVEEAPDMRQQLEQNTPLRRIGEVEDIASGVVYLSSPASGFLTGSVLPLDGGLQQPNLDLGLPDLEATEPVQA